MVATTNFSLDDALAGNVTQQDLQDYGQALGKWNFGGAPNQWMTDWSDPEKMKLLSQSGNGTGGLWQDAGGGQVSVPDKYLSQNMPDAGGFGGFDWGEMMGPGALLAGPFAGMMGAFGGVAGAGAGLGAEASALTGSGGFGSGFGSIGATSGAGALTGGGMDLGDWWDWGGGTNTGMGAGSDIYGNFDMGSGPTGTDAFTGGDAAPMSASDAATQLAQKVGPDAAKSILSRLVNGTATSDDYLNIAGKLGAAGLQALSSSKQSNSLSALANKYQEYGAPSRARFEASMTPGFDPTSIPGYSGAVDTASKGILARLSAQGGNPFGNPGGLIDANKQIISGTAMPAINEYQRLNANTGFGNSMNAALGLQQQGIGADSNVLAALGSGIGSLTAPDNSLASLLKQLKDSGLSLGGGVSL